MNISVVSRLLRNAALDLRATIQRRFLQRMFLYTNVFFFVFFFLLFFLRFAIGVMEWRENAVLRKKKREDLCWIIILLRSAHPDLWKSWSEEEEEEEARRLPTLWCWLYISSSSSDLYVCIHHSSSSYISTLLAIYLDYYSCVIFCYFDFCQRAGKQKKRRVHAQTKRAQVVMYVHEDERWQAHHSTAETAKELRGGTNPLNMTTTTFVSLRVTLCRPEVASCVSTSLRQQQSTTCLIITNNNKVDFLFFSFWLLVVADDGIGSRSFLLSDFLSAS